MEITEFKQGDILYFIFIITKRLKINYHKSKRRYYKSRIMIVIYTYVRSNGKDISMHWNKIPVVLTLKHAGMKIEIRKASQQVFRFYSCLKASSNNNLATS